MRYSDKFRGRYIKAADLGGKTQSHTIQSVTEEEVGGETKIVAYLSGSKQGLVLRLSNFQLKIL